MFHSFNKYLGDCYNTDNIISFIDRIIICIVYDVKGSTEKNTDNKNFMSQVPYGEKADGNTAACT